MASRWYKHLVCKCTSNQLNDVKRLQLANKSQQKDVIEWKRLHMERENRRQVHHIMIENEQYRVDGDQLTINQLTNIQRTFTQVT